MKNILIAILLLLNNQIITAQSSFIGMWEGKLKAGADIRMIFHVAKDDAGYTAALDCPDQGLKGVKASTLRIVNDSIYLEIAQFQAKYSGKLQGSSEISGVFYQGMSLPLNLKKIEKIEAIVRAQTPVEPFPYRSENLLYTNKDKSITYGATITIPNGKGTFPAALMLTGSGQQNRDEEILGHKPFAVIADHLTRNGFIVLRVDDRGMGQTTGDVKSSTTLDFANDAIVSLNYLMNRQEVDKGKVGLIGHSEGGMIAQIIASERSDLDFVIMLAAPGDKIIKLMCDQNEAVLTKAGLPEEYVKAYSSLYNSIMLSVINSTNESLSENIKQDVDNWIQKTPNQIVLATTGIKDELSKSNFVQAFAKQTSSAWFKYFLSYDPSTSIKKIKAKVLAVNGSQDVQVISKSNLKAIESALKESKSKIFDVKELNGLNHLFQECKSCTVNEYGQLEQTISPTLLKTITEWLNAL
jgi:pimeloyl-ACP methyl ester carboxylesterase